MSGESGLDGASRSAALSSPDAAGRSGLAGEDEDDKPTSPPWWKPDTRPGVLAARRKGVETGGENSVNPSRLGPRLAVPGRTLDKSDSSRSGVASLSAPTRSGVLAAGVRGNGASCPLPSPSPSSTPGRSRAPAASKNVSCHVCGSRCHQQRCRGCGSLRPGWARPPLPTRTRRRSHLAGIVRHNELLYKPSDQREHFCGELVRPGKVGVDLLQGRGCPELKGFHISSEPAG